jgi:hypothetical protein
VAQEECLTDSLEFDNSLRSRLFHANITDRNTLPIL